MTLDHFRRAVLAALATMSICPACTSADEGRALPAVTAIAPNFYYHDLEAARGWYVDKLGFKPVFLSDWLVMVEVAPGMEIALVDGDQGSLKPVEDKGAMLTIETEELEDRKSVV